MFGGHDAAQVVLIGHEQVKPLAQDDAALLGGLGLPGAPGGVGGGNRGLGVGRAQVGHIGQLEARGRVVHIKAAATCHPLAVDEAVGLEQGGVVQQGEGGGLHVHGMVLEKGG
ncbi:hypothetical protein D3C71_1746330 [compost metagenome]